jgi:hypothetical protein
MRQLEFAIITPSYAPDFERCELLSQTIQRHVAAPMKHYIVVDARDYQLFRSLANGHTEILTVESLVPPWIRRVPGLKQVWFSSRTLFLRNWMLQQIVKLQVASNISEDVSVFIDSDVCFVRPFKLQSFQRGEQSRLFRAPVYNKLPQFGQWHQTSCRLLGLDPSSKPIGNYVGNLITWRREQVIQLCQHVERITGRSWIEAIASLPTFSEYILYGTFIDLVVGCDNALHFPSDTALCHEYWLPTPMSSNEQAQFIHELPLSCVSMMISAKARMPVSLYRPWVVAQAERLSA